jgi:multidrug transporter EmrE-like cation transporter
MKFPFAEGGATMVWVVLFREPATAMRLVCITLIRAGIVGLKIASAPPSR